MSYDGGKFSAFLAAVKRGGAGLLCIYADVIMLEQDGVSYCAMQKEV